MARSSTCPPTTVRVDAECAAWEQDRNAVGSQVAHFGRPSAPAPRRTFPPPCKRRKGAPRGRRRDRGDVAQGDEVLGGQLADPAASLGRRYRSRRCSIPLLGDLNLLRGCALWKVKTFPLRARKWPRPVMTCQLPGRTCDPRDRSSGRRPGRPSHRGTARPACAGCRSPPDRRRSGLRRNRFAFSLFGSSP